jgi:DNA-binding CsgD family transcriptional regulator
MPQIELSLKDLSDLIGLVYESAFEPRQWHSLMVRLSHTVPGTAGVVVPFEGNHILPWQSRTDTAPELPAGYTWELNSSNGINALEELLDPANYGYVARGAIHIDQNSWRKSEFYRDYMAPYGFDQVIVVGLGSHGRRGAYLAFFTPPGDEAHDRLFEYLKLLSPHAMRAQQLARALAIAKRRTEVMGGFLDAISLPMLVTDGRGVFLFANGAGRRMLERGYTFGVGKNGLVSLPDDPAGSRRFLENIAEVDKTAAAKGLRVSGEDSDLLLCITPFQPSMGDVGIVDRHILSDARLFAVFIGQAATESISLVLLRDTFELTLREAEVCRDLLSGRSAAEIAEASGRALKTVRNQMQTIYEKLGVTSNVQLIETLSVFRTVGEIFEGEGSAATEVSSSPQALIRRQVRFPSN